MLTGKGPAAQVLRLDEAPLEPPAAGTARVRVQRCGVGFTDVVMRYGYYPYAPKLPFVPGYELVGVVDALGGQAAGHGVAVGDRVAALTVHGGYAEYRDVPVDELVPVPDGLDPTEAVALVLDFTTAYQMLHRVAEVRPGQSLLVTGAGGGVGNALCQLAGLAGARVLGTASARSTQVVRESGAEPVDYTRQDVVEAARHWSAGGVDASFDGLGGPWVSRCAKATRKGGWVVSYGLTGSIVDGRSKLLPVATTYAALGRQMALPGRHATFYGITARYRKEHEPFTQDLAELFRLLAQGRISPRIGAVLPLDRAAEAQQLVEDRRGGGKVVLVCDA
jgi:NADPH2:quinone reductase